MKFFIILMFLILSYFVFAQDAEIVHDPLAYLQMLAQMEMDVEAAKRDIEMVGYLYTMTNRLIETTKDINIDSFRDLNSYVQSRIDRVESIQTRINNLHIDIGEDKYKLKDLILTEKETAQLAENIQDALDKKDYETYWKLYYQVEQNQSYLDAMTKHYNQEAITISKETDETVRSSEEWLANFIKDSELNTNSIIGQLQLSNSLMINLTSIMHEIAKETASLNRTQAANNSVEDFKNRFKLDNSGQAQPGFSYSEDYEKYMKSIDGMTFDPTKIYE